MDLSPVISSHLDNISEVTGQTKSAIVAAALLDALPALLARAEGLRKADRDRLHQIQQQQKGRK
jgi:predicted transcriptional regulator